MSTTRARLQELGLDDLRSMAGTVEVDPEGLQKSKLIAAILESEKFDAAMVPETDEKAEAPATAKPRTDTSRADNNGQRRDEKSGDHQDGQGRRRRNRRNRNQQNEPIDESTLETRQGILDILPEGYGFLRASGYLPGDMDAYVPANVVRNSHLRKGDVVSGPVRPARGKEKFPALVRAVEVNGGDPAEAAKRPNFNKLTPLFPDQRLRLEIDGNPDDIMARIIDLISPIGKGQRGLIVSPPKAGKTTVLQDVAHSIAENNPECHLMVVLVDERPEEVTEMQRSVKG